ncbi:MAG: minor capsid protein [Bradymonadaceae bacterium]
MATKHTETIRDLLIANTSFPDSQIYNTPFHDQMEDRCVAQFPQGDDQAPGHFFYGAESERQKAIQVRLRGPANDFDQAYADAREIEDALTYEEPTGYMAVKLRNGPHYLATDDESRHEFSFNVLAWIIE